VFVAAAAGFACAGGDGGESTATPTAVATAEFERVMVTITGGCDRPEPGRGWEVLGLVRVTDSEGRPVSAASVSGSAEGPAIGIAEATDETVDGEALLFFTATETGTYTIRVDEITGARALAYAIDEGSVREVEVEVGEGCVAP
jgi:hypothetical protein